MKITPKEMSAQALRTVQKRRSDRILTEERDELATEEPLEIRVEGRPVAVAMRTPGHDEELAVGFLLTEGVIARGTDVQSIARAPAKGGGAEPNIIDVRLTQPGTVDFARLTRHVFTASSCGLCGKATIAAVQARHVSFEPDEGPRVAAETLAQMPATLAAAQSTFLRTGGLHAAGIFAPDGRLLIVREDVGRHNAVDKVIGYLALSGKFDPDKLVLLVSGRVAFEIVQKALAARIVVVAAISAPTSLAADLARTNGMTLVGFLREGRMNIYAGADRIVESG